MSHHAPNPAPPWPPNARSANDPPAPSVPGLNPQHRLSSQASFEYNHTAIPGLSFAGSTQPWPVDATSPSSHPRDPGLSGQEPNTNPKPSAPFAANLVPSQTTAPVNINAPITMEAGMVEEGELSEPGFEDLYEPYLDPVEENHTAGGPSQEHSTDDEDYDPANPGSPIQFRGPRAPWPDQPMSAESPEDVRERSRSYSPYLSPHEVETQNSTAAHVVNETEAETRRQGPHHKDDQDASTLSSDNLPDAKKKAQAAILRLWPLEVRYQDYLEEGIDKKVVHTLFAGLGLDTKSTRANHNQQPQVVPPPERRGSDAEAAQPTSPTQAPSSLVTSGTEAPGPAPAVTSEERKDRIARRLMAAKAAKQVSPSEVATHPSASSKARGSTSTFQADTTAGSKTTTAASQKKAEKERLLQEKLAKLQQSRALRAQKASEKASAASQTAVQEPSSAHIADQDQTVPPPAATHATAKASIPQEVESAEGAPPPSQPAPPIPGLFLSPSGSPLVNPRKRPVASDLNENSAAPPYKRTFNQNYVEQPLIINVSDGSDDEDIEMDMSSPVDGPAGEHPLANSGPPKSFSFRDHPPLTDKHIRRGLHRPASRTSNRTGAKDPDKAKLGHLNENISVLKQKIAEMQRQKGKTTPKDSPAQSSNETPAQQPLGTDMAPTRSHSAGSSAASQKSPAPTEPDVQRALPKVRRASLGRGLDRRQRVRVFSDQIPTFDASIATLDAKSRLFESQAVRARKEADDLRAQRAQAYQELRRLEAEDSASPEPEQAQLPNGQQCTDDHVSSPSGDRDNLAAQTASPSDNLTSSRDDVDIPAISRSPRPETDDVEDRSEVALPSLDSIPPVRSQAFEAVEERPQLLVPPSRAGGADEPVEDTAMDASPLAEEGQQTSGAPSQSPSDDAMQVDTISDGDEAYNPPEPSTEHEADAQRLQAEILSPALADNSTPPILANADSQESGTESAALPEHISKGVSDAADDDLDLPPQVHDGRPTKAATNLTSYEQSESAPEKSRTGFVPYESILKGFLSYRFHPNFHEDVAGGLKSPTYSNKINPQVQFCLDFLLGTCTRGASCKYQHIDAVGISESQTLLQLGNSERLQGKAYEAYVSGLRSLLAEFKAKQCKDFDAISEAIIDYRSRFYGDHSRVLPLGDVGL